MAENENNQSADGAEDSKEGSEGAQAATQQQEPTSEQNKPAPPWGSDEEFDPDKAWRLIQNLRKEKDELKPLADKAKELEDAQKTEQERLTEKLSETEKRAVDAELKAARLEVATEKGLPKSSVKFLTGTTPEELEESADELLSLLSASDEDRGPAVPSKPRERLRGGGNPTEEPEETDPRKLADGLPRF